MFSCLCEPCCYGCEHGCCSCECSCHQPVSDEPISPESLGTQTIITRDMVLPSATREYTERVGALMGKVLLRSYEKELEKRVQRLREIFDE